MTKLDKNHFYGDLFTVIEVYEGNIISVYALQIDIQNSDISQLLTIKQDYHYYYAFTAATKSAVTIITYSLPEKIFISPKNLRLLESADQKIIEQANQFILNNDINLITS